MIGNATIVALSEGVHAGAEPLEFRTGAMEVVLGRAFDVLFYLDTVTPACPK